MHNLVLRPRFEQAKLLVSSFTVCTLAHIYRELKTKADDLTKKALDLDDGVWECLNWKEKLHSLLPSEPHMTSLSCNTKWAIHNRLYAFLGSFSILFLNF